MNDDRKESDPLSDEQLRRWLKAGLETPPMSEAFSDSLLKMLDRKYRERFEPTVPETVGFVSIDTSVIDDEASSTHDGVLPFSALAQQQAKPRRRGLRAIVVVGAAAALLIATNVWMSSPSYGWAAMIEALQKTAWVRTVASQGEARGWLSSDRTIVAIQADQHVAYRDDSARFRCDYHADERVVYRQPLAKHKTWNFEHELLNLLRSPSGKSVTPADYDSREVKLVSESWRTVDGERRGQPLVELDVTLKTAVDDLVRLMFVLDGKTHLPVSGKVVDRVPGASASEVRFAYPTDGPSSIFALGVPRETQVVTRMARLSVQTTTKPLAETADGKMQPLKPGISTTAGLGNRVVADEIIQLPDNKVISKEKTLKATKRTLAQVARHEPIASAPTIELSMPLSDDELISEINTHLANYWQSQAIRPTESASGTEFLRRVYLDLTGRIPTVNDVYRFLEDDSPLRREHLVDELLARRDHATHLATVWRTMLLPEGVDTRIYGGTQKLDTWLADRFVANVPYDQLVEELLTAEGRVVESGPLLFYATLRLNPEEIATQASRVFLGMRMDCAQCHDHPFDETISQHDFWGFAAYFAQISRPRGKMEMTSSVLRVHDTTRGEVTIPDSDEIVTPCLPSIGVAVPVASAKDAPRRRQLVDWLTSKQNRRFARATVNRVWEHLFGRGLVMPVDDLRDDNEPLCGELLDRVSQDFAASGYDLRKLLRAIVLSDAYQLSSRALDHDPSQSLAFARMNIKSLTADQLFDCITVATQNEVMLDNSKAEGTLERLENSVRQSFIDQFRAPAGERTDYQAGIPQALTLMHGELVHGATDLASSGLLKSLGAPFFSDEQRIETLYLATLSRRPDSEERAQMLEHLRLATDAAQRQAFMSDILWALLNSAEFTFIH